MLECVRACSEHALVVVVGGGTMIGRNAWGKWGCFDFCWGKVGWLLTYYYDLLAQSGRSME